MTGFAFAHGTVDDMTSPTRMPVHLLALKKPAKPVSASDSALRSAIVNVANYYLRMAQTKSPAEMEAIIWGNDSIDGVDHGESCAAFASLTLALGAQATGQESWVTGGTTYPWPLHQWADVRVDPNPASPGIISVLQDAQAHNRWHPLGDGYQPQPGDWVLFDGHVEVVTRYSGGVLYTIGGDSSPNLSVNAHTFSGPLAAQGVTGFVDNGELPGTVSPATSGTANSGSASSGAATGGSGVGGAATAAETAGILEQGQPASVTASAGEAAVPGIQTATLTSRASQLASAGRTAGRGTETGSGTARGRGTTARKGTARMVGTAGTTGSAGMQSVVTMPGVMAGAGMVAGNSATANAPMASAAAGGSAAGGHGSQSQPGSSARAGSATRGSTAGRASNTGRTGTASRARTGLRAGKGQRAGTAAIPGLQAADTASLGSSASATPSYTRNNPPASASYVPGTASQQAFISQVTPGAMAAQSRYGIPAAVTIAQAIDESGWGQSALAIRDNNLFGIKGTGPAGSDVLPTQEFENGQWVTVNAAFRVYHNVAESIADHSELLATGPSYQQAMADRHLPDAFATDLTGVYATDPQYGSNLIAIMRLYNLYRYDSAASAAPHPAVQAGTANPGGTVSQGLTVGQSGAFSQGGLVGQGGATGHDLTGSQGAATIPGVLDAYTTAYTTAPGRTAPAAHEPVQQAKQTARRPGPRVTPRRTQASARRARYVPQIPQAVTAAFITSAKAPLSRAEPLYDDVASRSGIRWELLAACDWMQCQAQPRYSPVHGEKLGTVNADQTAYRTKSEALAQCAAELVELAMAVYWIDITARRPLSVGDLAKVFAAFRWGGLLKLHGISAMEFPYSVEGLTAQHLKMRWPEIKDPKAPDKPGTRFRRPFGAVPVVLSLGYPALA